MTTPQTTLRQLRRYLDDEERDVLDRVINGLQEVSRTLDNIDEAADDVADALRILEPEWETQDGSAQAAAVMERFERRIASYQAHKKSLESRLRATYRQFYTVLNRYRRARYYAARSRSRYWRRRASQYSYKMASLKRRQYGYQARIRNYDRLVARVEAQRDAYEQNNTLALQDYVERSALTALQAMCTTAVDALPELDAKLDEVGSQMTLRSILLKRMEQVGVAESQLVAPILGWNLLPVSFEGDIGDGGSLFKGTAQLDKPLSLTLSPFEIVVKVDGSYKVKFTVQHSTSFAQTFEESAAARLGSFWSDVQAQVDFIEQLLSNPTIILSKTPGKDKQFGGFVGGFNLFSTVDIARVGKLKAINDFFTDTFGLGGDFPPVVLGMGISKSQLRVSATLPLDWELGTPALVLNSLALSLTNNNGTSNQIGVGFKLTARLDNEDMVFKGGVAASETKLGSVWGSWDGIWKDPFGFKGITLTSIGIDIAAADPYPALRGSASFDHLDFDGSFALKLSKNPLNSIVDIAFNRSLSIFDVLEALTGQEWSRLNLIELEDVHVFVAPKGGVIAGKAYKAGMTVEGKADVLGLFYGQLSGSADMYKGGDFTVTLEPFALSIDGFEFIALNGLKGDVDIAPRSQPSGTLSGHVRLFDGAISQAVKLKFKNGRLDALPFDNPVSFFAGTSFAIENGAVVVSYAPSLSASVDVGGTDVGVDIEARVDMRASQDGTVATRVSFELEAFGLSDELGPYELDVALTSPESILEVFYKDAPALLLKLLRDLLLTSPAAAFEWAKDNVTAVANEAAKFFADLAENPEDIPDKILQGTRAAYGTTLDAAGQALKFAGYDATAVTGAVKHVLDFQVMIAVHTAVQPKKWFGYFAHGRWFPSKSLMESALKSNLYAAQLKRIGFPVGDIGDVLAGMNIASDGVAAGLKMASFTVSEVGGVLSDSLGLSSSVAAKAMSGALFNTNEVVSVLKGTYKLTTTKSLARTMKLAGYGVTTVGNVLRDNFGPGGAAMADALKYAGYGVEAVGGYLDDVMNVAGDVLESALKGAGYAVEEVADFVEDAVEVLNPSNW